VELTKLTLNLDLINMVDLNLVLETIRNMSREETIEIEDSEMIEAIEAIEGIEAIEVEAVFLATNVVKKAICLENVQIQQKLGVVGLREAVEEIANKTETSNPEVDLWIEEVEAAAMAAEATEEVAAIQRIGAKIHYQTDKKSMVRKRITQSKEEVTEIGNRISVLDRHQYN
jgi:hypothetical protein